MRLASKSYSDVPPAEITVMVVANLFLVPNFAFVMNGATVHYHAERSLSESNGVRYIFHICFSLLRFWLFSMHFFVSYLLIQIKIPFKI